MRLFAWGMRDAGHHVVTSVGAGELVAGGLGVHAELATHDTGADQDLNKSFSGHDLIARVRACET